MSALDVLVVGAGPAGSIAALLLARAGVRVRVIDRAQFPRPKLCGDTLNPGALGLLDRVGAGTAGGTLGDLVRHRGLPIDGMLVTGPGGARVTAPYPAGVRGVSLERWALDVLLMTAAVDAGAQCETGVQALAPIVGDAGRVTGVRVGGRGRSTHALAAPVVIAADGRASRLAARLRLSSFAPAPRRWAFGAYYAGVHELTSFGEMHLRCDGYVGVAALPGGIANVCVVREQRAATKIGPDVVASAVAADPVLRDRFAAARQVAAVKSLGPLAIDSVAAGCPGLLLAGDAAGFVDPMTGDGLRFALRGGTLAAEAALAELGSGQPAWRRLQAARQREFSRKWRLNRTLRRLAGSPRALTLAALLADHWSRPVQYLVGAAGDVQLARAMAGAPT